MTGLIGTVLWALIPGFIAKSKGRSFFAYFFLSLLISPLLTIIITICLSNLNQDVSEISEREFSEVDYSTQWTDVQHAIPQCVIDRCKEFSGDINRLENYLNNCAKESLIKREYIPAIIKQYVSSEQFEQWRKRKEKIRKDESTQNNDSNGSSLRKVTLANQLKGIAPDEILQHCDSISHKRILLETYLMQCENQEKISHKTAEILLEQYTQHMDN